MTPAHERNAGKEVKHRNPQENVEGIVTEISRAYHDRTGRPLLDDMKKTDENRKFHTFSL